MDLILRKKNYLGRVWKYIFNEPKRFVGRDDFLTVESHHLGESGIYLVDGIVE